MRPGEGRPLSGLLAPAAGLGFYLMLTWAEQRRPLRPSTQPRCSRWGRNLALAGMGVIAGEALQRPLIAPLTRLVEQRRWGVLKRLGLPAWLELPLAIAAMDYSLYLWHVWTHKGPLWRFHQVHHVDLDMDVTTALRFHGGELVASVPYRAAQVVLIGVGPRAFALWQGLQLASVAFHHANLRLPEGLERRLSTVLVTPRLHGVHHAATRAQTDSNWSSGLTIWDRLHGTFRPAPPEPASPLGVPAFRRPQELTLPRLLTMPFGRQRNSWGAP